jgi:hypothetical protein
VVATKMAAIAERILRCVIARPHVVFGSSIHKLCQRDGYRLRAQMHFTASAQPRLLRRPFIELCLRRGVALTHRPPSKLSFLKETL